jgi:hypothetical protein
LLKVSLSFKSDERKGVKELFVGLHNKAFLQSVLLTDLSGSTERSNNCA